VVTTLVAAGARRRAIQLPDLDELCSKGLHPRTPENCCRRGDCKVCKREAEQARRRDAGVEPRQFGIAWSCSHDPEASTRYVKGVPKGCKVCHREQPYNAERSRAYARTHRDDINTRVRAWRAVNRPDAAEFRAGDALAIEYAQIIDGDPCVYCGQPGTEKDHIIPVAGGGTGEWFNLAPVCRRCNAGKHTRDVLQFMMRRLAKAA
jgi:hypothetical protein